MDVHPGATGAGSLSIECLTSPIVWTASWDMPDSFEVDTAAVSQAERSDYWRACVCDQFVPLAVEPVAGQLRGRVAGSMLAETGLRRIRATRHRFERRSKDVRSGDPEVLQVLMVDLGQARMEQDGRTAALSPGDITLYDSSRPFRVETSGDFQFTIGLLPKRLLPLPDGLLVTRTARARSSADGVGGALGALLSSLATGRASASDPTQQTALQHALVSMYVAFMSDGELSGSPPSVHLGLAKTFIAQHLGDPALSPADIANACGISLSYLHRLFASDGVTVAGYVREQRLQRAYRDLTTSPLDERIQTVSSRWGIPDPAHFSRLFKGRFEMTPGEARIAARGTRMSR